MSNMNHYLSERRPRWPVLLLMGWLVCLAPSLCRAQGGVMISMGTIDGVDLTPDNVFGYTVQSTLPKANDVLVKGRLTYRATGNSFSYTYRYTLQPGMNVIDRAYVHPQWNFSGSAFRELFMDYRKLPAGTYEYCVEVTPTSPGGETIAGSGDAECIFGKLDDLFLINLVAPENNAKLHENFPVFTWMVNYPFASALTYRLRVAEVKEGQNNTAAINRNNPVYQETHIQPTTLAYPVYGKELEKFVPYAWTVDAYYKGLLLGGAEPWRFTIIDDSLMTGIPKETSFLDLGREKGRNQVYAIGSLKLKFVLSELKADTLKLVLKSNNNIISLKNSELPAIHGDNRYQIDFSQTPRLKHLQTYELTITGTGSIFKVVFQYINPDFL